VTLLGHILRAGVLLAAAIVLIGGGQYLLSEGSRPSAVYAMFRGEPADLLSVHGIVSDAMSGSARGLIQLGLLVLIATPIVRVVWSVIGFLRERDWIYVLFTIVVLGLLMFSLAA
jgi:uncharacterized membrane protein